MPQFDDDVFLGTAQTYMGLKNQPNSAVITGTISGTTLTVSTYNSGDPLTVGQYVVGTSVTANSYITANLGNNQYTLSQSSTVSSATTMYAAGNALLGDPAPMDLGVGPLGRSYVWDVIAESAQTNNLSAAAVYTTAGSAVLAAGTGVQSVVRPDGTTVLQLDCPRALSVNTGASGASGTPVGSTLSSVVIGATAGTMTFTATTGLVVGQAIVVSGAAGGSGAFSGYSNPTTYYITATNGTSSATVSTTPGGTAVPIGTSGAAATTFTVGFASANFTVSGYDIYGQPMTQVIASSATASTAVNGKKAFYQISSIAVSGPTGGLVTVGTTNILGLPVRVIDAGYISSVGWAGVLGSNAATFVAADTTNPATSATGDVRGTILPNLSSPGTTTVNGQNRLVVEVLLPGIAVGPNATRTGALGVTQA